MPKAEKYLLEDIKEFGFDDTVNEHFGSSMERTAVMPAQIEIEIEYVIEALRNTKKSDEEILGYLQELAECEEKEIYAYYENNKPFGMFVTITFSDDLRIDL